MFVYISADYIYITHIRHIHIIYATIISYILIIINYEINYYMCVCAQNDDDDS